jgi:pimeloyl-ACP methyl ester carboxylesterase
MGHPLFGHYYASLVQGIANGTDHECMMQESGAALLGKIGPVVMITHSQGGLHGWSLADIRPSKIKALVQIELKGPPFYEVIFSSDLTRPYGLTSIPLTYEPATTDPNVPLSIE